MKEYFNFNRRERNGIFVLLILMIFSQVLKAYVKLVKPMPAPQITYLALDSKAAGVDSAFQLSPTISELKALVNKKKPLAGLAQTSTKNKFKNNYQKKNNGQKSNNQNKKKADLNLNFSNTKQDYKPPSDTSTVPKQYTDPRKQVRVDINSSGIKRLQQVKGIGPVLSKRIVKYRKLVGGFHSISQLKEVYGIDDEQYDAIKDQLWINKTKLNRINIFTASVDSLSAHFYVSERTAKTIKAYVESTDKQKITPEEILSLDGVWYEATEKAIPYLILER